MLLKFSDFAMFSSNKLEEAFMMIYTTHVETVVKLSLKQLRFKGSTIDE